MKTTPKAFGLLVLAGSLIAAVGARGEVVYNNSSNRSTPARFAQTTGYIMGDEIILYTTNAWGYRFITNFVFEYYGSGFSGNEQARLRIYANDGPVYGTNSGAPFYEPGTVLFDSGFFSIAATPASTLAFNGLNLGPAKGVIVPSNFTWAVEFAGIGPGETAGLTLFDPPTVGSSYADYWEFDGSVWRIRTNASININFGAFVEAKVDNTKPNVSIVSPVNNFQTTSPTISVTGKATDGASGIALVLYRLGHKVYGTNAFTPITGSNSPNWVVPSLPLQPGTNFFQVKAVDGSGNESLLATRAFFYRVTNQLTVVILNSGTVAPSLHGQYLDINRDYTMTATPGPNFIFSNWLASAMSGPTNIASTAAKYTFRMQTNLVLIADFQTNRFIAAAGDYYGLFTDEATPIVSFERSGLFTLKTDSKQKFSGKLYLDGNVLGYAGTLNLDGYGVSKPVVRKGKATVFVAVQLTFDGSDAVSGTVWTTSNAPSPYVLYPAPFTSVMTGFKAGFTLTGNLGTNYTGRYTLAVEVPTDPSSPKGNGFLTINIKTNDGKVVGVGYMGDYAPFKPVVVQISKYGDWPLYATTYKGILPYQDKLGTWKTNKENNGMIWGWLKFTNHTGVPSGRDLLDGYVDWIKYPNTNNFYPGGFTNHDLVVSASVYNKPPLGVRVLDITNGNVAFYDGDLPGGSFTNYFFFTTNSQIQILAPNVNTQTMAIALVTGGVKGKFYHPGDPLNPVRVPLGVVLQDEDIARGVFKGTNSTGSFILKSD